MQRNDALLPRGSVSTSGPRWLQVLKNTRTRLSSPSTASTGWPAMSSVRKSPGVRNSLRCATNTQLLPNIRLCSSS